MVSPALAIVVRSGGTAEADASGMRLTTRITFVSFGSSTSLRERGRCSPRTAEGLQRVTDRLVAGDWDDGDPPARVHGDLWSGNVMWTADGVVLIDPAAHGGHRMTDLAMLEFFGLAHLDSVLAAYDAVHPLPSAWDDAVALHQLYPLGMHAVLFGGGYVPGLERLLARLT